MMASAFKCDSCGEYSDNKLFVIHMFPPTNKDVMKYELCPFCANEIINTLANNKIIVSKPSITAILESVKAYAMECPICGRTYEHVNGDYEYCPHCKARLNK